MTVLFNNHCISIFFKTKSFLIFLVLLLSACNFYSHKKLNQVSSLCDDVICQDGQFCDDSGECLLCNNDTHCGNDCSDCTAVNQVCDINVGQCIEPLATQTTQTCSEPGQYLDDGNNCAPCNLDTHCGIDCNNCTNDNQVCDVDAGMCVAPPPNQTTLTCINPGQYIDDSGTCVPCALDTHCGIDCLDCSTSNQVCDAAVGLCVDKCDAATCAATNQICDNQSGRCVYSCVDRGCFKPSQYCETISGLCLPCNVDEHCGTGAEWTCFDCSTFSAKAQVCDPVARYCVDSCANGELCSSGHYCATQEFCSSCNVDEHCGRDCINCQQLGKICAGDGCVNACVQSGCNNGMYCDPDKGCIAGNADSDCGPNHLDCIKDGLICNENWGICAVNNCYGKQNFTPCKAITNPDRSYDICVSGKCISPGCPDKSCNTPGPHFILPDTNQRNCYAFFCGTFECMWQSVDCAENITIYGQDARHGWDVTNDESAHFSRTSDEQAVVTDNITKLMWQGAVTNLGQNDALVYCDELSWAGYSDWRLPDIYELESIISYHGLPVSNVYSAIFPEELPALPNLPNYPRAAFWSSNASYSMFGWYVELNGKVNYRNNFDDNVLHIRCVRDEVLPNPLDKAAPRYIRNISSNEPTVIDNTTKLIWQGCMAGRKGADCTDVVPASICDGGNEYTQYCTWQEAVAYCDDLIWANHSDWRLPNIKELQSLVDTRPDRGPTIDADAFPQTPWDHAEPFWSSTFERAVSFASGTTWIPSTDFEFSVRCVRDIP